MAEMAGAEDNEHVWAQWWDIQDSLCHEVEQRIEKVSDGRSDQFKAALTAGLIEHLGEQLRRYVKLPESDSRPEVPDASA